MTPSLDRSPLPFRLGVYLLERKIGSGAMGDVYEATHETLGKKVALKVLRTGGMDEATRQRFLQEGIAASRIRHPNVVEVSDAGTHEDVAYLAMTLLTGESLADRLEREGRLPITQAVDFTLPLCAALKSAHEAGVLHRDLKPGNVFLSDVGRGEPEPILLDFGISKLLGPVDAALTENPQFLGTPLYLSPEQADGAPSTGASDQYSLALTLYECLLGVRPHEKHRSSLPRLLRAASEAEIPPPRSLDPSLPEGLEDALIRALSRQPQDRFDTMEDFGAALLPYASATRAALWEHSFIDAERTMTSRSGRVLHTPNSRRVNVAVEAPPNAPSSGSWHSDPERRGFDPEESAISRRADAEPHSPLPKEPQILAPSRPTDMPRPRAVGSQKGSLHEKHLPHVPQSKTPRRQEPANARNPRADWPAYLLAGALALSAAFALVLIIDKTARDVARFNVHVTTDPPEAHLRLDGDPVGRGEFHGSFPRDGELHELSAQLDGYETRSILFRDVPPSPTLELRPLEKKQPGAQASPAHPTPGTEQARREGEVPGSSASEAAPQEKTARRPAASRLARSPAGDPRLAQSLPGAKITGKSQQDRTAPQQENALQQEPRRKDEPQSENASQRSQNDDVSQKSQTGDAPQSEGVSQRSQNEGTRQSEDDEPAHPDEADSANAPDEKTESTAQKEPQSARSPSRPSISTGNIDPWAD